MKPTALTSASNPFSSQMSSTHHKCHLTPAKWKFHMRSLEDCPYWHSEDYWHPSHSTAATHQGHLQGRQIREFILNSSEWAKGSISNLGFSSGIFSTRENKLANQVGGQTKTSMGQTADRISEGTPARVPSIPNLKVLSTDACSILSKMDDLQLHIQQEHHSYHRVMVKPGGW